MRVRLAAGAGSRSLAAIQLQDASLGDAGVTALSVALTAAEDRNGSPFALTEIGLEGNDIGPTGSQELARHLLGAGTRAAALATLNLRNNRLGDEGVAWIARALHDSAGEHVNRSLVSLDVGGNRIRGRVMSRGSGVSAV